MAACGYRAGGRSRTMMQRPSGLSAVVLESSRTPLMLAGPVLAGPLIWPELLERQGPPNRRTKRRACQRLEPTHARGYLFRTGVALYYELVAGHSTHRWLSSIKVRHDVHRLLFSLGFGRHKHREVSHAPHQHNCVLCAFLLFAAIGADLS